MDRLSEPDQRLLDAARGALPHAHAPYSRFAVGAAVASADGRLFAGVNVENASYGLTVCAERVALFTAIAAGARELTALALTTRDVPSAPAETMPCGACRQVMVELLHPDARVIVDRVRVFALAELLPDAFVLRQPPPAGP